MHGVTRILNSVYLLRALIPRLLLQRLSI